MDPIIKQMEKKRKITTYEDLIITDEDIPDKILLKMNQKKRLTTFKKKTWKTKSMK